MKSTWNKNILLFRKRFPHLFEEFSEEIQRIETIGYHIEDSSTQTQVKTVLETAFPFWTFGTAKNGLPTIWENGVPLHSVYNPVRESEQIARQLRNTEAVVFLGFGIGYLPVTCAQNLSSATLILVEPDILHFLAALTLIDWTPVFGKQNCILSVGCSPETVLMLVEKTGIQHCRFFSQKNQTAHAETFFSLVDELIKRNSQKQNINTNTLERFAGLWLKNSCRNIRKLAELDGVDIYRNAAKKLPVVVLAAGPSLADILPYLAEIKKRSLIVCVDTALRACLRTRVEPDFIMLVDPQYWAARHIAGLASPSSVLITESAAYPSVYRFPCRKTVLCSSLFPLGAYFEKRLGTKGHLDTGGSVSTTAWDFARLTGTSEIYMAGLDLGFPEKKTHIAGSTFEEESHMTSRRDRPAETAGVRALFSAQPEYGTDFCGNRILTDKRMKLFAWWFESKIASGQSPATYTFCTRGLRIPGMQPVSLTDFMEKQPVEELRMIFFRQAEFLVQPEKSRRAEFDHVYSELLKSLEELYHIAQTGESVCQEALAKTETDFPRVFSQLTAVDTKIMNSSCKNVAALVFPTEKQLELITAREDVPSSPERASLCRSKIIYRELRKAITEYVDQLAQSKILFS